MVPTIGSNDSSEAMVIVPLVGVSLMVFPLLHETKKRAQNRTIDENVKIQSLCPNPIVTVHLVYLRNTNGGGRKDTKNG